MVRLTGRHPFNVEAPLTKLMDEGMITTPPLHFVRDHGAVPKLDWDTHTITIDGLVDTPITVTMDELASMPNRKTFPVTVTCAGNRRKEQNMIKKSVGFNWGPCAVGNHQRAWRWCWRLAEHRQHRQHRQQRREYRGQWHG